MEPHGTIIELVNLLAFVANFTVPMYHWFDVVEVVMMTVQEMLSDPVAQEMLTSTEPARFAYTWTDGSPRVIPIWFHWTGSEVVLASPVDSPKFKTLSNGSPVALTIDSSTWPHHVLLIRGTATIEPTDGIVTEYAAAAERYFGPEQGRVWVDQLRSAGAKTARIGITPLEVRIIDFETRFPSAVASILSSGSSQA